MLIRIEKRNTRDRERLDWYSFRLNIDNCMDNLHLDNCNYRLDIDCNCSYNMNCPNIVGRKFVLDSDHIFLSYRSLLSSLF